MSTQSAIVISLAVLATLYALVRGGQPERYCALIIGGGIIADRLLLGVLGERPFDSFDLSRFLLDGMQMFLFLVVALKANRIYPLAIAAAQFLSVIGSIAVVLVPDGINKAYWIMTQAPLFLQLFVLVVGTHLHRRRVATIGEYNGWSPSPIGQGKRA